MPPAATSPPQDKRPSCTEPQASKEKRARGHVLPLQALRFHALLKPDPAPLSIQGRVWPFIPTPRHTRQILPSAPGLWR